MSSTVAIGGLCALSVVVSVALTLTNNVLMRDGAVHPTGLVLAHASACMARQWWYTEGGSHPSRVRSVPLASWVSLTVLALGSYVQVVLWNVGIAQGATMADFQLFKLTAPLWSAVVAGRVLGTPLSAVGWASCACSGLGLGLGSDLALAGAGAAAEHALGSRAFLLAAAMQPMSPIIGHRVFHTQGIATYHPARLVTHLVEVLAATAALQAPAARGAAGGSPPAVDARAVGLLALSTGLAVLLRYTTHFISIYEGGPVLYAILSPAKAALALVVAAASVPEDRLALDARKVAGLAVCLASLQAFLYAGKAKRRAEKSD